MTEQELVDTKQYCDHLTNPPPVDNGNDYNIWHARQFYTCSVISAPCTARYVEGGLEFGFPYIDKEKLEDCQFKDIPIGLAKKVHEADLKRKKI